MPLGGHDPTRTGDLGGVHDAVGGTAGDHQAVCDPIERLMVHAVAGRHLAPDRLRDPRPVIQRHVRVRQPVVLAADVLLQRAAHRHVQHLHAAADREHRHVRGECSPNDRQLNLVVLGDDAVQLLGRRFLPVVAGVDVAAAVEHHRVDPPQQIGDVLDQRQDGRQHQRRPAGAGDGVEVATSRGERLAAHALGFGRQAADDEDQRVHRVSLGASAPDARAAARRTSSL